MPPVSNATVITSNPGKWVNRHENVVQPINRLYDVWNTNQPTNNRLGDLQHTVAALQRIMADAAHDGMSVRAVGGGWSHSRAAVTNGRLINTKPLNWYFPLAPTSIHPAYGGNPSRLVFMQCGLSVDEANNYLAAMGLALPTSGASNGQTIVGAFSTGTHGSAFDVGAMQDYVVGLHIITAPDQAIWLERGSQPVVTDDFAGRLGAIPVRDDTLFNAAVVSFGSFGLIHAVLVEAVPLFLLEASRKRMPVTPGLRHAMTTLDFSGLPLPHPGERPFHFGVLFNPHDAAGGAYVSTMYKRPYHDGYVPPQNTPGGYGPGDDLLAVVGTITDKLSPVVGPVVNTLIQQVYPEYNVLWGKPGEIFSTTTTVGKGMSIELGVPMEASAHVMDLLFSAHPQLERFPGFIACRYVKRSRATLAFTRFPVTCTIEMLAAYSANSQAFYERTWGLLEAEGIPYTLHWGQMNNFTPQRVRAMYGDAAVDSWIGSRHALLSPIMRQVFSSPFLQECGLAI